MALATYGGLEQYPGLDVIKSQLAGQVPEDVKRNLIQGAAERGVATGMPGAPITNAQYLRGLGLTSLGLQQQGLTNLSPLYQQQVSEAGQTTRQAAQLETQQAMQDKALAQEMERLKYSTSAAERQQAAELAAALQRTKLGTANAMDIAKLEAASRKEITKTSEAAAMERLKYQTENQAEQAELDRVLNKYGVNLRALTDIYQTGVQFPQNIARYNDVVQNLSKPQGTWDYSTQKMTYPTSAPGTLGSLYELPATSDLMYYMNPNFGG